MNIFKQDNTELENLRLTSRLEKGRLKSENTKKDSMIASLESKVDLLKTELEDVKKEKDYFVKLETDAAAIEQGKKQLSLDKEDFEYDKKLYERKNARLEKEAEALSEEKNVSYKSGYSDGLADGLRKAHDITREDRKYLTMIAMATNSSEAIKQSKLALGDGHESDTES